jgi:hypothetical protein
MANPLPTQLSLEMIRAFYSAASAVKDTEMFAARCLEEYKDEFSEFSEAAGLVPQVCNAVFAAMAVAFCGKTAVEAEKKVGINIPETIEICGVDTVSASDYERFLRELRQ